MDDLLERASKRGILSFYYNVEGQRVDLNENVAAELLRILGGSDVTTAPVEMDCVIVSFIDDREPVYWQLAQLPSFDLNQKVGCRIELESGYNVYFSIDLAEAAEFKIDVEDQWSGWAPFSYTRKRVVFPVSLPVGYHRLHWTISSLHLHGEALVMVAPEKCFFDPPIATSGSRRIESPPGPGTSARHPAVGLSVQLYALQSSRNGGMGDLQDLSQLMNMLKDSPVSVIGVNPIHPLFTCNPERISPYFPSSRRYWNYLYCVPQWMDCFQESDMDDFFSEQEPLVSSLLDDRQLIPYESLFKKKMKLFETIFDRFSVEHLDGESRQGRDFVRFQETEGDDLEKQATFDAFYEHFFPDGKGDWSLRMEEYASIHSRASQELRQTLAKRVLFYKYLYWSIHNQLERLQRHAASLDMKLYMDLAVGISHDGAGVWSDRDLYALPARIGAPPDPIAPMGQDWGLAPIHPLAMRKKSYKPLIKILHSSMLPGGVVRIDHVMSLFRLYWVTAQGGGFVAYPYREWLAVLALESQRRRCIVIGEDLGTVPDYVRREMKKRAILSWKVLYFEKENHAIRDPATFSELSVTTLNTHDLATLGGYWAGRDIQIRNRLHLVQDDDQVHIQRGVDRQAWINLLRALNLVDRGTEVGSLSLEDVLILFHKVQSRSNSGMVILSLHDLLGDLDQPNLPGTYREYPNWSIPYPVKVDAMRNHTLFRRILDEFDYGIGQSVLHR